MKASVAALSLTFFIAGCSACAERRPIKATPTLADHHKIASAKETSPSRADADVGAGSRFRLSNFLNKSVRDKTGKEVARLEDLAIGIDGRVVSVTLAINGKGAKVTVPFEKLKVRDQGGDLYLETDVVLSMETSDHPGGTKDATPSETAPSERKSDD